MMMAQMFGTIHRDQMAQVREELDQIRKLNQDLHALQARAELVNRAPAGTPPAVPATGDTTTSDALLRIEALLLNSWPHPDSAPKEGEPAGPASTARNPGLAPSLPPTGAMGHQTLGKKTRATEFPTPEGSPAGPASTPSNDPSTGFPGNLPDDEIHAFLSRRIATLQMERQGRWQKLLGMIVGR